MILRDILPPSAILAGVKVEDKKQLLADLAEAAARASGLKARDIHMALVQRERLGSTGIGRGIAIPHGRMPGLSRIVCLFTRLEKPVMFESADAEPVDLVFLLLAPEDAGADHLKVLARLSRLLRQTHTVDLLRATHDPATLHAILTEQESLKKAG